ncbi:hypothetical protein Tdes44962_MAKER03326 [Teratosphaeria destructans]|uniref:Uncharacterized protein n=1 Tax=Teratosphaeria destructans TaxID=418781 RepID=A0A9W7SQJ6_9PEZI|nr:hypothetical protein Tdes44962_MAKER03326 [Teratosphaeria destructans]
MRNNADGPGDPLTRESKMLGGFGGWVWMLRETECENLASIVVEREKVEALADMRLLIQARASTNR